MKSENRIPVILLISFLLNYASFSQKAYTLANVLQLAKANSAELKMGYLGLQIAETDIITAKLRPNPILNNQSLQLANSLYFPPGTSWDNGHTRQIWWQITKPLMLPALRKYKIEYAEKNAGTSGLLYLEKERGLLYDVAGSWINCWTLAHQITILQLTHTHLDSLLIAHKTPGKVQQVSELNLAKTGLKADQYALKLRVLQQNHTNELATLTLLTGHTETLKIDTASRLDFSIHEELDRLVNDALNHRADILSVKSIGDAAASNIKLQKSMAWPTPELGAIYNPQNTIPYIGFFGTVQIPLFSRNQGEIKKSFLLKQQSEERLIYIQQEVKTELLKAFNSYQAENLNLKDLQKMRTQSHLIYKSALKSFEAKEISLHVYLEEQKNWLEIETLYYETLNNYAQSYIHLLYVAGLINKVAE